jgi:hypothetical protein
MQDLKYILANVCSVIALGLVLFKVYTTREIDNIGYIILFLILTGQFLLFVSYHI